MSAKLVHTKNDNIEISAEIRILKWVQKWVQPWEYWNECRSENIEMSAEVRILKWVQNIMMFVYITFSLGKISKLSRFPIESKVCYY